MLLRKNYCVKSDNHFSHSHQVWVSVVLCYKQRITWAKKWPRVILWSGMRDLIILTSMFVIEIPNTKHRDMLMKQMDDKHNFINPSRPEFYSFSDLQNSKLHILWVEILNKTKTQRLCSKLSLEKYWRFYTFAFLICVTLHFDMILLGAVWNVCLSHCKNNSQNWC